jgi:hypothetical protein
LLLCGDANGARPAMGKETPCHSKVVETPARAARVVAEARSPARAARAETSPDRAASRSPARAARAVPAVPATGSLSASGPAPAGPYFLRLGGGAFLPASALTNSRPTFCGIPRLDFPAAAACMALRCFSVLLGIVVSSV